MPRCSIADQRRDLNGIDLNVNLAQAVFTFEAGHLPYLICNQSAGMAIRITLITEAYQDRTMIRSQCRAVSAVIAVLLLSGCEGSLAKNVSHPGRKDVIVGNHTLSVVPLSDHWASWWVSNKLIAAIPPLSVLKPLQITAIENTSGCTVVSAEYQPGSLQPAYLQASVKC